MATANPNTGGGTKAPPRPQVQPAHRLQILFPPESYARVTRLRESEGLGSLADVMRNALKVYEWFVEQKRNGYDIALVKDNKVEKIVEIMV